MIVSMCHHITTELQFNLWDNADKFSACRADTK